MSTGRIETLRVVRRALRRRTQPGAHGDRADRVWGVLDVLAVTDFPDVRFKAAIQSAGHGSILLIPRESGQMVRLYVDLGTVTPDNRDAIRAMTPEEVEEVEEVECSF